MCIKRNNSPLTPKENLVKGGDIIIAVVSHAYFIVNVKQWVNFRATRHICAKNDTFTPYNTVRMENNIYILEILELPKFLMKKFFSNSHLARP